jgi:C_GCAxxG_C_C family probable redox protein
VVRVRRSVTHAGAAHGEVEVSVEPADRAAALFDEGFSCSQSVLMAHAERLELSRNQASGVAACFGGGMSRMGGVCGAVTGAFMVLGLHSGKRTSDDTAAEDRTREACLSLVRDFRARHGSIRCRTLIGVDLNDTEARQAAKAAGLFAQRCTSFVRDATSMAEVWVALSRSGR